MLKKVVLEGQTGLGVAGFSVWRRSAARKK
jgi:hypothetical protein